MREGRESGRIHCIKDEYDIVQPNNTFAIGSSSGVITIVGELDFDGGTRGHILMVTATVS